MTGSGRRVDGRTARSERTRNAIVDAHIQLVVDGDLRPTADRIAKAAGVSLRALWSHFPDMEALLAASAQRILDQRDASYEPVPPGLPLAERINAFCAQRARMLEQVSPASKAAAIREPFSPALADYRRAHLDRVRIELLELFPEQLRDDPDRLAASLAATTWGSWNMLRTSLQLTPEAAEAAMRCAVRALLS